MPVIIAFLGLIMAAGVWAWRIRAATRVSRDLAEMAGDVLSAARRLGFNRRLNLHPVESVDDPALAISGLGIAFLELSSLPTAEQQKLLTQSIARNCNESQTRAEELLIVGRWLVSECKGPQNAIPRLTKRLYQLDKTAFQPLLAVLNDVGQAGGGLSPRQRDALEEVSRGMKLS